MATSIEVIGVHLEIRESKDPELPQRLALVISKGVEDVHNPVSSDGEVVEKGQRNDFSRMYAIARRQVPYRNS